MAPKKLPHIYETTLQVALRKRMMCNANNCGLLLHSPQCAGSVLLVSCSCITSSALDMSSQCDIGAKHPQSHQAQDRPDKLLVALEYAPSNSRYITEAKHQRVDTSEKNLQVLTDLEGLILREILKTKVENYVSVKFRA